MHILNGNVTPQPDPAEKLADDILSRHNAETAAPPKCAPIPIVYKQWTILGPCERYISANDDVIVCCDVVQDELLFAITGGARGWTTLRNDRPLPLNLSGEVDLARGLRKYAQEAAKAQAAQSSAGVQQQPCHPERSDGDMGAVEATSEVAAPGTNGGRCLSGEHASEGSRAEPSNEEPGTNNEEHSPLHIQPAAPIDRLARVFRKGDQLGDPFTLYSPDGFAVVCMGLVTDALLYNISGGARGWGTLRCPEPLQINVEQQLELGNQLASAAASFMRSEELAAELVRQGEMNAAKVNGDQSGGSNQS